MFSLRYFLFAVLLVFCFERAFADDFSHGLQKRDDTSVSRISETASNSVSSTDRQSPASSAASTSHSLTTTSTSSLASFVTSASVSTFSNMASTLSASSAIATSTGVVFNSTLTPNALPLTPKITPAFGIAGIILMVTGVGYTFVGTRKRFLHVSVSTAYLSALAVTVLIIYAMHPPISNAIQGAFLVAAVMTGLILGAGSLVFPEYTQSLGGFLGGFCIGMWILTLRAGGSISSTGGKAGLLVVLAVVGFAISFSHYTRPYTLPGLISFSGATAIILGIDCFSKAGLKEFWAYIWDVNDKLFPAGAATYPLTTGIKAESGIIFVLFVAGTLAQANFWKSLKEQRDMRKDQKQEQERAFEEEEENVGRRIEEQNSVDRSEWEAIYGSKEAGAQVMPVDSVVGEMESLKKAASTNVSTVNSRDTSIDYTARDVMPTRKFPFVSKEEEKMGVSIDALKREQQDLTVMMVHEIPVPEMPTRTPPGIPASSRTSPEIPTTPTTDIPDIAVRDFGTLSVGSPKPTVSISDISGSERALSPIASEFPSRFGSQYGSQSGSRRVSRVPSQMSSHSQSRSASRSQTRSRQSLSRRTSGKSSVIINEAPEVIPLPFRIPTTPTEEDFPDDSSSIATFNDNPEDLKRKSRMLSVDLSSFIDIPPQSRLVPGPRPRPTNRRTAGLMATQDDEDKRFSVMANVDDDSDTDVNELLERDEFMRGEVQTSMPQRSPTRQSLANGCSEFGDIEDDHGPIAVGQAITTLNEEDETDAGVTPLSDARTISTGILDEANSQAPVERIIFDEEGEASGIEKPGFQFIPLISPPKESSEAPRESSAEKDDEPVGRPSLSKDTLPATVSKVVMSYRTNEWAKHLDTADVPIVEDPNFSSSPTTSESDMIRELPAPVDMEALQQTPQNAAVPPAPIEPKTRNQMPRSHSQPHLPRSNSNTSQPSSSTGQRFSRLASKPAFGLRGTSSTNRSSSQSMLPNAAQNLNRSSSSTSLHSNYTTASASNHAGYKRTTSTPVIGPTLVESPNEDGASQLGRASHSPFTPNVGYNNPHTLMSQRDTMIRSKSSFKGAINAHLPATYEPPTGDDDDDDTISMSARRDRLRQSSLNKLTSAVPPHHSARNPPNPTRSSTAPPPQEKEQMLRMWRASVQQDLQTRDSQLVIERQRSQLWEKKQREALRRQVEGETRRRSEWEKNERLRRGNLEEAHRDAMRRLQAAANKKI